MPLPSTNLVLYGDAGLTNYQDVGTGTSTPAASNNDPVGHIIDQSGSGNDLVAATSGARASLQLGAAPSGLNAWQFTATGPNILQSRSFPSALAQPYTLFMVMKQGFYGGFDVAWCGKTDNVYWYVNGQSLYPYWALNATTDAQSAQYVDASWHLFTFLVNGSSTIVRMDGHIVYNGPSFGSPGSLGLDSLTIGGYSNLVSFPWSGQIGAVALYSGDQTANFAAIEGYLQARWGTPALATSHFVVFEGDSITHGPAGGVGTTTGPPYLGYPNDAAPLLAPMATVNCGESGYRIVSYSDNPTASLTYKATTRENPFSPAAVAHVTDDALHLVPSGKQGVLHVLIGINDIFYMQTSAGIAAGITISTIFNNLKTYCLARRAAGWNKIVVGTLTSSNLGESQRESLNTLIRGDSSFYDALADYAADSRIGADGAYASTTYFLDGTHPTTTGQQIMAGIATAAIQSLFPVALAPSGIATAEVDGTPTIGLTITRTPAGIGSAEVDGTPTIGSSGSSITLSPQGIATSEIDGTPSVSTLVLFELQLASWLATQLGVSVYPLYRPQSIPLPTLTYQCTDMETQHSTSGANGLNKVSMQFTAWDYDYGGALATANALRNVLDGYRGAVGASTMRGAIRVRELSLYNEPQNDSDQGVFQRVMLYDLWHYEPIPTGAGTH